VPRVREQPQHVQHARLHTLGMIAAEPQGLRQPICRLEADALHLDGQPIGVTLHHQRGAIVVFLHDAIGQAERGAMRLEQQHHVAQPPLLGPATLDALEPAPLEPRHLPQLAAVTIQHLQRAQAKCLYDALGKARAQPWNHARAQVALDAVQRLRRQHHQRVRAKLPAVARVICIGAGDPHQAARCNGCKNPHHRDTVGGGTKAKARGRAASRCRPCAAEQRLLCRARRCVALARRCASGHR
jgi:hypothetical protein